MPLKIKPTRYAHPEGHTSLCYYDGEEGGLVTCGADGDVRYWLNLMDDDPSSVCIAEQATSIISKNGKLYAGNDNNTVQILTYPGLERKGVVTRFSATVTTLASTKDSKFVVSGACDMRIQVTNIATLETIELNGHEAPILGLSLDPKDEYVASSSADGTIRIWSIKDKKSVHIFNDAVPTGNSFFTAKTYSTPSFNPKDGSTLAYPQGKQIIIVERDTWDERMQLNCPELRNDLNLCKYSECGTRIAASSVYGEIVVWDVKSGEIIGYAEHHQNPKITSLAWHLENSEELAFCDSLGQLGCVDVVGGAKSLDNLQATDVASNPDVDDDLEIGGDNHSNGAVTDLDNDDEDDDGENVISLNKIKKSVSALDDDAKSHSDMNDNADRYADTIGTKNLLPEVSLQAPFQPGSSPVHLLSRYMVWNDTGTVRCYTSESSDDSSIEVEFHGAAIHHSLHINNYLRHTMAALSSQALALSCPSGDGAPSKLVVVVLQGWGSGNKEWSIDLPEGEESVCVAAGDTFVALATSRRNLRLFMIGGTQREIIALPGPTVAMNALGNHLVVAYHTGVGASSDQHMNLMWIRFRGPNLYNRTLSIPLAPSSELSWLGLTDLASPAIMDEEGLVKIYDRKSCLWRVACDTDQQCKGKMDHFFIIGIGEKDRTIRCLLCKGSRYPSTTPRPTVSEIPMKIPLCDPDSEKTGKEAQLWQIGSHPHDENEAVLSLIALACRGNVEFRAVEICEQIASEKVLELAIKYAGRMNRMALANKLETIADNKERESEDKAQEEEGNVEAMTDHNDEVDVVDTQEDIMLTPSTTKKSYVEIKPLTLTVKRSNPFLKTGSQTTPRGLANMSTLPEKPAKTKSSSAPTKPVQRKASAKKNETFLVWLEKNKSDLQEEFPDLGKLEFSRAALARFKEEAGQKSEEKSEEKSGDSGDGKKRKLSSPDSQDSQIKRTASNKLTQFLYDK